MPIIEWSAQLKQYILRVEQTTGKVASLIPVIEPDIRPGNSGYLKIGPDINGLQICYRNDGSIGQSELEKTIAHELTHGLLFYSQNYSCITPQPNTTQDEFQRAADVMDFIDDIIIDTLIQKEGFPSITSFQLASISNNTHVFTKAKTRDRISVPNPGDPVRSEINFVGQYIYAWGMVKFATLGKDAAQVLMDFQRIFPQVLPKEFSKAKEIKSLIQGYSIFTSLGRDKVLISSLKLWKLDTLVRLSIID